MEPRTFTRSLHELIQYVGWKDIQSAMRYLNQSEAFPNRITANEPDTGGNRYFQHRN